MTDGAADAMTLEILNHSFAYECECILRLFFPGENIAVKQAPVCSGDRIVTEITGNEEGNTLMVRAVLGDFDKTATQDIPPEQPEKEQERLLCVLLFELLCEQTGKYPPWGILTGVRPVRYCHIWREEGIDDEGILDAFAGHFGVLPSKARLALETAAVERKILRKNRTNGFSLYVSIPFCPSRCLYCSFVSHDIKGMKKLLPDYIMLLNEEIRNIGATAKDCGLVLQTIYIGGGTPTTLEVEQLEKILATIRDNFDFSDLMEYTVEAGRPDTITAEKMAVLRSYGVNRLSINPQTMDDAVLKRIGRGHTAEDIVKAYDLARKADFPIINADLIAGLPGELPEGFMKGLEQIIRLGPENITVHTLAIKRSSRLREEEGAFADVNYDLSDLLDDAKCELTNSGYLPYYLYRQKGTRQNLENVGYAKPGTESAYNVFIMEEVHNILAAGAGGVTKLCASDGRLKRIFNLKYPYEYISRHREMLQRKTTQVVRGFLCDAGNY